METCSSAKPAFALKLATGPLDCDAERALTPDVWVERAVVASMLGSLLQLGIHACDIPTFAESGYTEDRCAMEWIFGRCDGDVELVMSAEGRPIGKIVLAVGSSEHIVKSWSPVNDESLLFSSAMAELFPEGLPEMPALIELILALDETADNIDSPEGLTFVNTAALKNLVREARRIAAA